MIETADLTIEISIKRCRTLGDEVYSYSRVTYTSRIEVLGMCKLKIGSSDFDIHRSSEFNHKGTRLQAKATYGVRVLASLRILGPCAKSFFGFGENVSRKVAKIRKGTYGQDRL